MPDDLKIKQEGNKTVMLGTFSADHKTAPGMRFHYIQFLPTTPTDELVEFLGQDEEGNSRLVSLVNGIIKSRIATATANSLIVKNADGSPNSELMAQKLAEARVQHPDGVLVSVDQALAYRYGVREKSMESKINDLRKEFTSKKIDKKTYMARLMALMDLNPEDLIA